MNSRPPNEPAPGSSDFIDSVERILFEGLEEFEGDVDRALEELCIRHPEHAEQFRARMAAVPAGSWTGAVLEAADELADSAPDTIGPYRPVSQLGSGGMGVVYLAEQEEPVRRRVALKLMRPGMDHGRLLKRFALERRTLAMLNHSGVARILDAGTAADGRSYFAMEYVDGVPLTTWCDRHRLGIRERLQLLRDVCLAVHHAHQKGVIHRDLKPDNLLVTQEEGRVLPKVIDFGLARITHAMDDDGQRFTEQGTVLGTPEYMSPEQAAVDGAGVDVRADVYSLGVVMYELLTGHLPVEMDDARRRGALAVQDCIARSDPALPSRRLSSAADLDEQAALRSESVPARYCRRLRGDLDWITMRALAKDPGERYQSAQALADELQCYLDGLPVAAGPPSAGYRLRKFALRYRALVIAAGVLLVSLVAGLAISLAFYFDAEAARVEQARRAREADHAVRFMVDLFDAANPYGSTGEAMPVGMLLHDGTLRLQRELPGDLGVKATLSQALGQIYLQLGSFDRAEQLLREANAGHDRLGLPRDHVDRIENRLLLARVHLERGEVAATAEFETLLSELRAQSEPDGRLLAGTLAGLGVARALRADHDGALEPLRLAAESYLRLADDASAVLVRMNHAGALWDLGRVADARREFEELLAFLTGRHPSGHALMSMVQIEFAGFLASQGETEDAVAMAERAVAVARDTFGGQHVACGRALLMCATVLQSSGRLQRTEELLAEALRIFRDAYGENHTDIAWVLNDLGMLYLKQARAAEAEPLLARAQAIYELTQHPFTPIAMGNRGAALVDLGRTDEAEDLIGRAVEWFERESPRRIGPLGEARLKLAYLANRRGDPVGAARIAREVIELVRDVPGQEWLPGQDWVEGRAAAMLAFALNLQGKPAEAEVAARQALELLRGKQRTDDLEIALALWQLGASHLYRGQLDVAEPTVRESIAMLERLFPDGHPHLIYPNLYLGARLPPERNEDAVALLEQAVLHSRAHLPADSRFRLEAVLFLAQRLVAMERWEDAEPHLVEAWEVLSERDPADPVRAFAAKERAAVQAALGRELRRGEGRSR